ncbi:MAG: cytochrome C, partial [Gallionella sp.]
KAKGEEKLKDTCFSCHKKDDDEDGHKGKFGEKCESCHIEKDWDIIPFDHDKDTDYKLYGKHKDTKCVDCHKGELYEEELKTDCFSCHEGDDEHEGQEGKKCETCHDEKSWTDAPSFDHNLMSKFTILGGHSIVKCKECHAEPTFKDAKSDCWSCHEDDDVHKRKLGTECKECHNVRNWLSWDFDHNQTDFKLDSPHEDVGCYECHQHSMSGSVVASSDCGSCHDRDDVHNGSFGNQCQRCHDGDEWSQIKIGVGE